MQPHDVLLKRVPLRAQSWPRQPLLEERQDVRLPRVGLLLDLERYRAARGMALGHEGLGQVDSTKPALA